MDDVQCPAVSLYLPGSALFIVTASLSLSILSAGFYRLHGMPMMSKLLSC